MHPTVFHYAFKVKDLESTRHFYVDILGCREGRSTETWVDFDFFGHQLSAHVGKMDEKLDYCGLVDGVKVPIPHFGCVLDATTFVAVQQNLEQAQIQFVVKPQSRYSGQASEQMTMFVLDFSGNPLEFKSFKQVDQIFV